MILKKLNVSSYLFTFSILVLLNIYYIWGEELLFKVFCLLSLLIVFFFECYQRTFYKYELVIIFFLILLFYYISLPGISGILTLPIISMLGMIVIFAIPLKRIKTLGDNFFKILSILLVPSLIAYFLIVFNIELSYDALYPSSGEKAWKSQFYRVYHGSVFLDHLIYKFNDLFIPRLLGVFDEPGLLGTVSSLYLAAKKFKLKNKRDYIFLISGLLSLSLAFFTISFLYFLLYAFFYNKFKQLITALILVLSIASVFPEDLLDFPLISRIHSSLEEPSSLNNRTSSTFEKRYMDFIDGDEYILFRGNGNAAHTQIGTGLSSIKSLLFNYGIVGCFMIFTLYFVTLIHKTSIYEVIELRGLIIFILLFIASAYQRPDLLTPHYYFIFLYGVAQRVNINN